MTSFAVRARSLTALALVTIAAPPGAQAQDAAGFAAYLVELRAASLREGVSAATLDQVLPGLTLSTRAIALDRAQPEGRPDAPIPPFAPYRARHVDAPRINGGRAKQAELAGALRAIERERGVPAPIVLAIYGHETAYGRVTGDFDIPQALASLAYEGRRRALFEGEFIAAMKMIDRGVPPSQLKGSWAGAMGKPQFLPSVYLRLAVDGDGDHYADIWDNEADALASIAHYFTVSGWRSGEPWGVAVRVPATLDRAQLRSPITSPRCPRVFQRHSRWLSIAEWRALGVTAEQGALLADSTLASLIEPDGPGATAYLATGNYRVILDYNCSNFYALSVGLLADAIAESQGAATASPGL